MAAAGRNGPSSEPFTWLLGVGSLLKEPPRNWIRFLPGVRVTGALKRPITAATNPSLHHSINWAFKEHTTTHSWQKS